LLNFSSRMLAQAKDVRNSDEPTRTWEGFRYKGLDDVRLITLWSVIDCGSPDDPDTETSDLIRQIGDLAERASLVSETLLLRTEL
jgi:hypothetical protein